MLFVAHNDHKTVKLIKLRMSFTVVCFKKGIRVIIKVTEFNLQKEWHYPNKNNNKTGFS